MSEYFNDGAKLTRKRSYTPRRDINAVKAELAVLEAAQTARNLTKEPPNGKEKYRGNGAHSWEVVTGDVERLRVPGGWIYATYDETEGNTRATVFVPLPTVLGYAL